MKRDNLKNGRKYLQIINLIRGLYSKYIKNSYNSTDKKTQPSGFFFNGQRRCLGTLLKKTHTQATDA